jgi:hypothetical protein
MAYMMYDVSGELTVIVTTVWWLKKLGRYCQSVYEEHRRSLKWRDSIARK